jgi:hypothetical protein
VTLPSDVVLINEETSDAARPASGSAVPPATFSVGDRVREQGYDSIVVPKANPASPCISVVDDLGRLGYPRPDQCTLVARAVYLDDADVRALESSYSRLRRMGLPATDPHLARFCDVISRAAGDGMLVPARSAEEPQRGDLPA